MNEVIVICDKNETTGAAAGGGLAFREKRARMANSADSPKPDFMQTDNILKNVSITESASTSVGFEQKGCGNEVKNEYLQRNLSNRILPKHKAPTKPVKPESPKSWAKLEKQREVWGCWCQPVVLNTPVRSKNYLSNRLKIPNGAPPLLELTRFDFLHINERIDNVGSHKNSWLNRSCPEELRDRKFLVINIQVTAMKVMLVQYFVFNENGSTGCDRVDKMWEDYVQGTDSFRDRKLKLIPTIVEGPWLVRSSVPTRPCIIGTKVKNRYYQGANYYEVDIETDASYIAKGVLSLLQGYSNYSVDLTWILEAVTPEELPERILAAAHLGNPDYEKAISLESP